MSVLLQRNRISEVYNTCTQWSPFSSTVGKRLTVGVVALHISQKREEQKYWHPRVIQLVNYVWGGNDCPSMRMNNKCVSKKKRYFYSFPFCCPAIFAQLRWVLRKNYLRGTGESVKASYFLEFRSYTATHVQPENYRLRKEASVLYSRLRSEVRSSLRATFSCTFQFLRVF